MDSSGYQKHSSHSPLQDYAQSEDWDRSRATYSFGHQVKSLWTSYVDKTFMVRSCYSIWHLKIRGVQESDSGCYACQINTSPMKSQFGCIDVGEWKGETHALRWGNPNLLFTVGTTTSITSTTRGPFSRYTQRSRVPLLWDRRSTSRYSPRIIYYPTTTETSLRSTNSLNTEEATSGKNHVK